MSGKAVSCLATLIAVTILLVCKSSNVWGLQPDETQGSVAHGHRPHENVAHSWPHANVAHLSIDKASALPTNPKLFGLNDVLGPVMQIPYDSVALTSAVESLRVGYLRHPGGTVANYWNVTSGRYAESCSHSSICNMSSAVNKFPEGTFSPANFVKYLTSKTGAKLPVFDLNVLTMSEDTFDMQVNTLAPFCVDSECYVEIGNELHIAKTYEWKFPNVNVYMNISAPLIAKLRKAFPKVKIVVPAGFLGDFVPTKLASSLGLRQTKDADGFSGGSWSHDLVKYRHLYDAITIHDYGSDSKVKHDDNDTATTVLATYPQTAYTAAVKFCRRQYGQDISIMITEYNEGLSGYAMLDRNGGPHALNMLSHVLVGVEHGATLQSMQYHAFLSVDTMGWDRASGMVRLVSFKGTQPYVNGVSQLFAHTASIAADSAFMANVLITSGAKTSPDLPADFRNKSCLQAAAFTSASQSSLAVVNRCNDSVMFDILPAPTSSIKVVAYDCSPSQQGQWVEMPSTSAPFPWSGPLKSSTREFVIGPGSCSLPPFSFSIVQYPDSSIPEHGNI